MGSGLRRMHNNVMFSHPTFRLDCTVGCNGYKSIYMTVPGLCLGPASPCLHPCHVEMEFKNLRLSFCICICEISSMRLT